ncbi:MAG: YgcG family protein [Bdellovibrionales bacterium]|nr:YgcG family protein [Bdellovibrionales bacterium]
MDRRFRALRSFGGHLVLTVALVCLFPAFVLPQLPVPELSKRVTDRTGTLSAGEEEALEQRLADFEQQKGIQLAVLIVPTTEPEAIEQYSMRVAEAWQLGRRAVDDGVLLLVAKNDRRVRIEVGYGLEGSMTDVTSKRIIEEQIVPEFRQGNFGQGITHGVSAIIDVLSGEALPPPHSRGNSGDNHPFHSLFFGLLAGAFLRPLLGRLPAAIAGGLVPFAVLSYFGFGLLWSALFGAGIAFLLFIDFATGHTVRSYGGRGGYYSGGGFGGGGFSGGGGSFGGGGASGSW